MGKTEHGAAREQQSDRAIATYIWSCYVLAVAAALLLITGAQKLKNLASSNESLAEIFAGRQR